MFFYVFFEVFGIQFLLTYLSVQLSKIGWTSSYNVKRKLIKKFDNCAAFLISGGLVTSIWK